MVMEYAVVQRVCVMPAGKAKIAQYFTVEMWTSALGLEPVSDLTSVNVEGDGR